MCVWVYSTRVRMRVRVRASVYACVWAHVGAPALDLCLVDLDLLAGPAQSCREGTVRI
jgi:hypothetical protein